MTVNGKMFNRFADFGMTIHELLRYGYGGLLVFFMAALVEPIGTENVINAMGPTISIFFAFALGGVIYIGHRPLIGEPLYLLHELLRGA